MKQPSPFKRGDTLVADSNQVGLHHVRYKRVEAGLVMPAELGARFARIANQNVHFGRPEIARIHLDENLARRLLDTFLLDAPSLPYNGCADMGKGLFDE